MKICVFGAASNKIEKSYILAAEKLGERMAERGHTLVFGAGAHGMMGASARGAYRKGGEIIGVIPSFFKEESIEEIYENCTELIYTETMAERKSKMEDLADAFIILPGGIGTFEEFFQVLTLKQLGRHTKPIAIYNINNYYSHMEKMLENAVTEAFLSSDGKDLYYYDTNEEELLVHIESDTNEKKDVHDLKFG
ncbi:MAG: TIGR00730 family Rossman fold protein [Clostridia bacterium]|nr:TIGR00730 family Rossman fold protein [Clostridia bacterium]